MIYAAKELIPHRNEMLFVHRIFSLEPGVRATGEWRPLENRWLSSNPESEILLPTMPLEALAQLGACAVFALDLYRGRKPMLAGFENVEFSGPFNVGNIVQLSVEIISLGSRFGKAYGVATVEKRMVCHGKISFVIL